MRSHLRRALGPFMLTLALLLPAGPARADTPSILDQSALSTNRTSGWAIRNQYNLMAETFTVAQAGLLTQVGVQVYQNPGLSDDLYLELFPTAGGVPVWSSPLYQATIPNSRIPVHSTGTATIPATLVDVSAAGLQVHPGDVYAIGLYRQVAQPGLPPWMVWVDAPYAGGHLYLEGSANVQNPLGFQTYVTPEPASLALLLLGGVALLPRCRRPTG